MKIHKLPIGSLIEARWNPNELDEFMVAKLRASISRFGLLGNLVVRPAAEMYEVLSGNHRLRVLRELGHSLVPCVVVELDDGTAKLLAQALNHIKGEDNLGLRAELLRSVLGSIRQEEVLSILPETSKSLSDLASLGKEELASRLASWQMAQGARLDRMQFQVTAEQKREVNDAIDLVIRAMGSTSDEGPNRRGTALYLLSKAYIERRESR